MAHAPCFWVVAPHRMPAEAVIPLVSGCFPGVQTERSMLNIARTSKRKKDMTILEKIKMNAKRDPDRAVMRTQLSCGEMILRWGELDLLSDRLASYLITELKTRTPVIVYGHKNPLMLVCFLACVKAGRAYCPIDVNVPLSRTEAIINEVKPEIILATEPLDLQIDNLKTLAQITDIISSFDVTVKENDYVQADDVFYIIFTSGSTGTPKGVQITRDCLDHFIHWAVTLGNGTDDSQHRVFLNQAPFSFDLSVMDLYLCLYTGGTLWALSKGVQSDMKALYASLSSSDVNIWVSTPSFADVCLADPVFSEALMPQLTDFYFCGEVLTNKTVERLTSRFPSAKVVNTYGPTESTCAITQVIITEELNKSCSPLPVGKPKAGTWLFITDEAGESVAEGEKGEIVIAGDSVSTGYWHNEERNKKSFGLRTIDGKDYRTYKTGDEGYVVDGMLYYCGRIDNQVKLHGYRIELEDIESNLLKVSGIVQAVVLPKYRDGKVTSLVAGVVSSVEPVDDRQEAQRIKDELKAVLPEYMIPKKIKFVPDIPRTNNGKIDRKAMGGIL